MSKHFLKFLFCILCLTSPSVYAQEFWVYDFNKTLSDTTNKRLPLAELDLPGQFVTDTLKGLGNYVKTVYTFQLNSGLSFDNTEAGNPIGHSYTIELYFKLNMYNAWKRILDFKNKTSDTGPYIYLRKISFYKYGAADIPPLHLGEYVHFVITRDSVSKRTSMYINGVLGYQFKDSLDLAVPSKHNQLNIFHDNLSMGNEASSGAIAYLKISKKILPPEVIKTNSDQLVSTFKTLAKRPPAPKPTPEIGLRGNIMDKRNGAPIPANLRFERVKDNSLVRDLENDPTTGDYKTKLRIGNKYYYYANSNGFLESTDVIDLTNAKADTSIVLNIEMSRIVVGKTITLNRIIFKQGTPTMLPQSYNELDKLIGMMKENGAMEIELSGHTDNQGDPKLNLKLSEERVAAVKDYLVSNGINGKRIKGKGYGGSKPIASNANETTRKLNRRVEFKIVKY